MAFDAATGVLRWQTPKPGIRDIGLQPGYMGQSILDPPSVEGWYTGQEWINSGSLLALINFVADRVADTNLPGVKNIIADMKAEGVTSRRVGIPGDTTAPPAV